MAKSLKIYVCNSCAYESVKWLGQCPSCKNWSSFEEGTPYVSAALSAIDSFQLVDLSTVAGKEVQRISTGYKEFDRVLGGGLVPGEVILISGEPGIGKSTLLLQVLEKASKKQESMYISAEESVQQLAMRANRIFEKKKKLNVISGFEVSKILGAVKASKSKFIIIDSIQTLFSDESRGLPGGYSQVRTVASKIVTFAKQYGVTTVIVGQITKQGSVAGPKLLEHLVDVVLQIDGDEERGFRILRSLKNRYGSVNEVGLFEMRDKGMVEVADPSYFFRDAKKVPMVGVCPAAVLEGNRVLILEVQALTASTPYSLPKRVAEGVSKAKLELLSAIISKYTSIKLHEKDIYVNIAGGIKMKDPALDLPLMLAIMSSALEKPIKKDIIAFGEISLTGAVGRVSRAEVREKEIIRLGYKAFSKEYGSIKKVRELHRVFS